MKKLLQINVTANWGSTGKIVEQIGQMAMQQGWESYIAYGRMMNPSKSKLIKVGNQLDVYLHYVMSRFFDLEGLMSKKATKILIKEIEKIQPDIIHLHNIHDHYLNYKILFEYLAKRNTPIVWTQHDQWATTGHCAYNTIGCERWKTQCYNCPAISACNFDRSKKNYELKKRLFTSVKTLVIVPVSNWICNEIRQSFLKDYPIQVIHNGIDLNVFKPLEPDMHERYEMEGRDFSPEVAADLDKSNGGKFIILGVASSWSDSKGLSDYVRLSGMLSDDYQIVLIGVSDEIRKTIPEKIICLPRTDSAERLMFFYTLAGVVTSLSYSESQGLTPIEGIACGTPAIVYDNTAQPELIDEGCGIVVPTGNLNALVTAIKEIKSNGKVYYEGACRERAVRLYNKEERFHDYMTIYERLLNNK